MKFIKKLLVTTFFALTGFLVLAPAQPVQAQLSVCDVVEPLCVAICGSGNVTSLNTCAVEFVDNRLNLLLALLFGGIILLAVFMIIQAGVKYIQSQGDEGKIADAQKSIKSVFIGVAVLILGVVGIFVLLFVLNLTTTADNDSEQAQCISNCTGAGGSAFACTAACADGNYQNDNLNFGN